MSTSGTYSFAVTRDDIIRQAMLNIRRLDPDESPTPEETNDCARTLNMLVKQWQGKSDFAPGLKVWTRKTGYRLLSNAAGSYGAGPSSQGWTNGLVVTKLTGEATSSLSVASVIGVSVSDVLAVEQNDGSLFYTTVSSIDTTNKTLTPASAPTGTLSSGNALFTYTTTAQKPLNIETIWLRDSDNSDTPMNMMNVQDWSNLPNKEDSTDEGDPTAVYWEDGLTTSTLYTDVGAAQDTSKYLVMKYMEPVQDFNSPLDNPYYPQEWYLALCWGLSEQISPMFGANWTEKMENLKNGAMMIARNKGAENSTLYFQPGME